MRFLDKFADNGSFTHSQRAIASYMQENVESVAFCTLGALADKLGVSTTTIIRFSRAIGFAGVAAMQQAVKDEIQGKSTLPERLDSMENIRGNDLLKESFAMDEEKHPPDACGPERRRSSECGPLDHGSKPDLSARHAEQFFHRLLHGLPSG